jgi:hypothetical protein
MKHKKQSISISRILDVFRGDLEFVAVYQSTEKKMMLCMQEFEMVLLAITEGSCESNFTLQKYIPAELILSLKSDLKSEQLNQVHSSTEAPNQPTPTREMTEDLSSESKQVIQFLLYQMKNLKSIELIWTLSENQWFLTSVLLERQPIKPRCSSARPHLPPPGLTKGKSRPVTASHRRDSVSSAKSVKSAKSVSCIEKVPNEAAVQTDFNEKCECQVILMKIQKELDSLLMENRKLESEIAERVKYGENQRNLLEEKWKERCLEVSKVVSEKFFEKGL